MHTNTGYVRPQFTYQDRLSTDDIKEKLNGYKQIKCPSELQLNNHIRYFSTDSDGNKKFRLGGFVDTINLEKGYITLRNNKNATWSVQLKTSTIYKKLSKEEFVNTIKESVKKDINNTDDIKSLKEEIASLNKKMQGYSKLKTEYKKLYNKYKN